MPQESATLRSRSARSRRCRDRSPVSARRPRPPLARYVAFRNANGGVCGRQLVLHEADDGTDNGGYRRALQDLAPQVLGLAGGIALGDAAGADLVEQFGIPIVNTPSTSSTSRWVFDVNPDYPRPDLVIGKYKYLYEQGARTVAMAYLSVEATRREAGVQRGLMEAAGLKVVDVNELPITTLSYDAAARRAANSGANYLWTLFDTQGYASMARAVSRHWLQLAGQGLLLPNLRHRLHRSRRRRGRGSDGVAAVASHRGELTATRRWATSWDG